MMAIAGLGDDRHDTGPRHPERHARLDAARAGIADAQVETVLLDPRAATRAELERVHTAEYLDALETFCRDGGGYIDGDTPVSSGSWATALESAGAGLAAVESGHRHSFVVTRPPGHHARPVVGMGFCLFNNIAVAAAALLERGERVAIVDWDVHHGNGTQEIFWDEPRVVYASTHQYGPLVYPGTGPATETGGPGAPGTTVNVPLPAGATGDVVARAIDTVALPVIDRLDPTWILVSAGFDAHRADPLADLRLAAGDFADLARLLDGLNRPMVLFLEGGYDLDALRASVAATVAALEGSRIETESATNGGPGRDAVAEAERIHARLR